MTNVEISQLIQEVQSSFQSAFSFEYFAPAAPERGHTLNLESNTRVGTISIWATGSIDWHIFDISTEKAAILGHAEVDDIKSLQGFISNVLNTAASEDTTNPRASQ